MFGDVILDPFLAWHKSCQMRFSATALPLRGSTTKQQGSNTKSGCKLRGPETTPFSNTRKDCSPCGPAATSFLLG